MKIKVANTMVEISHVTKSYNTGTALETTVLKDISYQFLPAHSYAIIGKSGCGKTTFLNILSGLDTPDCGSVLWNGEDIFAMSRRQRTILRRRATGYIFQSYNLLAEHTAWENIIMPYTLDGKRPNRTYLSDVCQMLQIDHLLKKYPSQMSGGEQQRVAIARALAHKPGILFADEPTGNLDPATGEKTLELLMQTVGTLGNTLIMVTHDMDVAKATQQIIRIDQGTIL